MTTLTSSHKLCYLSITTIKQAFITQWDFNWLMQLHVIAISDRIKVVAHPDAQINTIYTQGGSV